MATTGASVLYVRYSPPQQTASAVSANSSGRSASSHSTHHSHASSSKKKHSGKKSRHSRRQPSQKAPTPERISEIQSSLARGGYYQGEPNGKWDANTIAAMQKFQSANGLGASGKLDAPSLQKLGLGSGIAGVSAPKPPCCSTTPNAGSSCCSMSPSGSGPAGSTAPAAAPKPAPAPSAASSSGAESVASAQSNSPSSAANSSAAATSGTDAKPPQR